MGTYGSVRKACKSTALGISDSICEAINMLSLGLRIRFEPSLLKPAPEVAAWPDVEGEKIAVQHLHKLSRCVNHPIHLIVNPCAGSYLMITSNSSCLVTNAEANKAQDEPEEARQQAQLAPDVSIDESCQTRAVWCYLDAVDGTLKLSGLFNQPRQQEDSSSCSQQPARLRVVNDGAWAVGVALTDPTSKTLQQLQVKDFKVAVIADGNPPKHERYPIRAIAEARDMPPQTGVQHYDSSAAAAQDGTSSSSSSHTYQTYDGSPSGGTPLCTSSCCCLSQCFAYLDAFQAHDSRTAGTADAELAVQLYRLLIDRHDGGAFDVLRQYGNLGSVLRNMLGWRQDPSVCAAYNAQESMPKCDIPRQSSCRGSVPDEACKQALTEDHVQLRASLEPQCGLFMVVNENLANLIPAVPVVVGAGGIATDFHGKDLLERRLVDGRLSVVYAANAGLHAAAMRLVKLAARQADVPIHIR